MGSCVCLALIASPGSDVSIWRTSLLEDIESRDRLLVVAERAEDVIGYGRVLRFVPEPDAPADIAPSGYYLMGLVVHPDHRRRGVAAALTRARLEWISKHADEAWYFANARNAASIALHAPFGFDEVTRSFVYPRVDFDLGEGVLFRLRFPSAGDTLLPARARAEVDAEPAAPDPARRIGAGAGVGVPNTARPNGAGQRRDRPLRASGVSSSLPRRPSGHAGEPEVVGVSARSLR